MSKVYVGAIIADIHAGAIEPNRLYHELDNGFIKYLKSMKVLDFVIIAGDLFDSKVSLNSDHTKYIFKFLKNLMNICIEKNTKLRIIKGTESHDNQQLDVLKTFLNVNCDVAIITKVEQEILFDDFSVLYIPEEYMKDKDAYYREYFLNDYDMIIGHGLFNEVAFVAKAQQSEVTMSRAPIFKSDTLIDICKGPIFFGHIHKPQCIKDKIYYVGSYSRWCFGEEEPKGFMTVAYTPDNGNFTTEFIENKNARTFDTLIINCLTVINRYIEKDKPSKFIEYTMGLVNSSKSDKLRIIFNIPEEYEQAHLLVDMINEVFSKRPDIKVIINNNAKEIKNKKDVEERMKVLLNTYDFLFDKNIEPDEKLSRYIKIKYNKDISLEEMRNILHQKLLIDMDRKD